MPACTLPKAYSGFVQAGIFVKKVWRHFQVTNVTRDLFNYYFFTVLNATASSVFVKYSVFKAANFSVLIFATPANLDT